MRACAIDHRRAAGADKAASRSTPAQDGARHTLARSGLVCPGDGSRIAEGYEFRRANRARWPIATMARLLRVSTSGYYGWLTESHRRMHAVTRSRWRASAPCMQARVAHTGRHVFMCSSGAMECTWGANGWRV
jgi:hypothetical protein